MPSFLRSFPWLRTPGKMNLSLSAIFYSTQIQEDGTTLSWALCLDVASAEHCGFSFVRELIPRTTLWLKPLRLKETHNEHSKSRTEPVGSSHNSLPIVISEKWAISIMHNHLLLWLFFAATLVGSLNVCDCKERGSHTYLRNIEVSNDLQCPA